MNMLRWWKAARLLLRNMAARMPFVPEPIRLITAQGTEYASYQPAGTLQRRVLLVYGMTIAGEKEARLVHFARALASCGFQVIVPCLTGLKTYTFDPYDLERLADLIASIGKDDGHLGMVGFSAGGSMSLVVASRPGLADLVDILLLFSPFASLHDAWNRLQSRALAEPEDDAEWDHFIWCMCVLAYLQREQMGFQGKEQAGLEHILANYCTGISPEEKRTYYVEVLRSRRVNRDVMQGVNPQIWDAFSPRGKLASLKGRVMILHDPHDPWAPPEHSQEIVAELLERGRLDAQQCLVSPLISHVTPRYLLRLTDIFHAVNMVGELYP